VPTQRASVSAKEINRNEDRSGNFNAERRKRHPVEVSQRRFAGNVIERPHRQHRC
jgi:hypothetical protein